MSRHVYYKSKRGNKKWNKYQYIDDRANEDGSGDHLRLINPGRRDHGSSGRRSFEMVKRAFAMNLIPGQPNTSPGAPNSGLGIGETWCRIAVIAGANSPVNVLHEMINTAFGTQLRFYNTAPEGRNMIMYAKVRHKQVSAYRKAAQNLRDPTDNKSYTGDLILVPEPRVPPSPASTNGGPRELPAEWLVALRGCFQQRFQPSTRALDLSGLHHDPSLLNQGLYLPLNRAVVVHALINILKENNAQLNLLNLANNRLSHLNSFCLLAPTPTETNVVRIEKIDLSANPLSTFPALSGLRGVVGLMELDLSDTVLASRFKENDGAFSANLAKVLPGLKLVNGKVLPQPVQFAIEQTSEQKTFTPRIPLPDSCLGYFPNDEIRVPLLYFLKDYFTNYDSRPRGENMLPYYTSSSQLVVSVARESRGMSHHQPPHNSLTSRSVESLDEQGAKVQILFTTARFTAAHINKSRNLLMISGESRPKELIARGSLACASLLGDLPATEHPLESFSVDVLFHSDTQMVFTVAGVFYEIIPANTSNPKSIEPMKKVLRSFSRTMVLIAPGGQIVQDDLIIANPSQPLCKKYITAMGSKSPNTTTPAMPTPQPSSSTPDPNTQNLLVSQLRQISGMNEAFSRQCLEEYNWNAEMALNSFRALQAAGKLPPEAF